ncbi:hypothetical protein CQ047_11170 [Microbacterium sp. MYb72]|uniref:hypothetical protein n=1 Tax=Microbacterium sp. MYb72 TaxID=1848693 RepID=UPI000CFC2F93|nr:hypothetical protein [Microbacterium sp. MYb72]PRB09234.1 hypothetical protein CQ047_11170 [Microbacterium sp. MYb72]
MLSFIAAAVPTVGGLYVAWSMLIEYTRAAHTARVFERIEQRYNTDRAAISMEELGAAEYERQTTALGETRRNLMRKNGLDPYMGTRKALNASGKPQPPRSVDLRRQWVLLVTSTAGVILVAIDVATSAG